MPQNRDKTAQPNPPALLTPTAVPNTGTNQTNNTGVDLLVFINGSTMTGAGLTAPGGSLQSVYTQASGVANWCLVWPNNWQIQFSYTGSPNWFWVQL